MANITLGQIYERLKGFFGRATHVSLAGTANIAEGSSAFAVDYITAISNDSDSDITFNFDAATDLPGNFTLKPGEVYSDVPKTCATLYYKAAADGKAFRAWGVK